MRCHDRVDVTVSYAERMKTSVKFLMLEMRVVRTKRDDLRPFPSLPFLFSLSFSVCSLERSTINEITTCRFTGVIGTRKTMLPYKEY